VWASLQNLGEIHQLMGEYAEARARFERSLAIWEKVRGPDHPDVAVTLNRLAEVALEQERPQEMLQFLERAVGIFEAHEGVQDGEAKGRLALARALVAAGGDLERARSQANQAAEAYREAEHGTEK